MPAYRARPQVGLLSQRRGFDPGGQTRNGQIAGLVDLNGSALSLYGLAVRGAMCARQLRLTTVNTETPIRYYLNQMLKRAGTGNEFFAHFLTHTPAHTTFY